MMGFANISARPRLKSGSTLPAGTRPIRKRQATFYLRGNYRPKTGGERVTAPLLAKVPFGRGTIIFTSFHNEKVNSELETKLLKFLVFAAVTAKETAAAQEDDDFRRLLSSERKPVEHLRRGPASYQHLHERQAPAA